jgi:aspartyl-tRNA(Asn)/glutamyl-tRNA(Gln) amidotransferase subunit C
MLNKETKKETTKETMEHVSKLARLKLSSEELEQFGKVLSAVFENFEKIAEIDTAGVKPLVTPTDMMVSLRPDIAERTVASEKLLENAPDKSGRLFKVPPVV